MQLSKELLGNIIEKEIKEFVIEKNELRYILENDTNSIPELYYINIYELANKCKEWALKQRYVLFSKIRLSSSLASCYFDVMGKHDYEDDYHNDFRAETESEAIFKSCQWILDNKTNKEG